MPPDNKTQLLELRHLANKVAVLASRLEGESSLERRGYYSNSWDGEDRDSLLAKAVEIYEGRRKRTRTIPFDIFGEPAWDILLDLFIMRLKGKRVSISSVCIAADVPPTTALRWVGLLQDHQLVERVQSEVDRRVAWIKLSDRGCIVMTDCIREILGSKRKGFKSTDSYVLLHPAEEEDT